MDIKLTPDATLPDDTLHVTGKLDDELLAALSESRFDVIVEDTGNDEGIRMSPTLVDRIMEWMTIRRVSRRKG